jgi:hypothetical protein
MFDPNLAAQLETLIAQTQQQGSVGLQRKPKQIARHKFTPEEDEALRRRVAQLGTTDWNAIAQQFPNRTARQCRDRWRNYISPDVVTGRWTQADEEMLLAKVQEIGPRWALIAQHFPGRTDIGIKNHYISITGKRGRNGAGGSQGRDGGGH